MGKQKVAIVADGACSLTPAKGEELGIHIAPVYITFGNQTYQAGVNLQEQDFYRLLSESKKLPTTAQPTAQDFVKIYESLPEDIEEIITIVISHHMSATLQSAEISKEQYTKRPVHVFDSESVSLGFGMMAMAAAQAAAEGKSAQQILEMLDGIKKNINIIFTVKTLEYLHKGGRIGGATAFLGSALDIKPILNVQDGRIEPLEKQRTRSRSVARLVELMEEKVGKEPVHIAILHGNSPEEAVQLEQAVKERFNSVEMFTSDMGPVIGVHAGPGTLGLVFYPDNLQ